MKKNRLLIIIGTRPEAIKMGLLINELSKKKNIFLKVCFTGQHDKMINEFAKLFNFKVNKNFKVMNKNDLADFSAKLSVEINKYIKKIKPNYIIVHGDTSSSAVASYISFLNKIPVMHVEAGLRTYNIQAPFPEEFNRIKIDSIAKYLFAPTKLAKKNLKLNNIKNKHIFVTGNTIVDSLKQIKKHLSKDKKIHNLKLKTKYNLSLYKNDNILITIHRRENYGNNLIKILKAIKLLSFRYSNLNFIFPVHLNPNINNIVNTELKDYKNIFLTKPMDYLSLLYVMSKSKLILTDSGGIQEEAPSFNKPVILLRNETERPEGMSKGFIYLTGANTKKIIYTFKKLFNNQKLSKKLSKSDNPYGDGKAVKRIVKIIENIQ